MDHRDLTEFDEDNIDINFLKFIANPPLLFPVQGADVSQVQMQQEVRQACFTEHCLEVEVQARKLVLRLNRDLIALFPCKSFKGFSDMRRI